MYLNIFLSVVETFLCSYKVHKILFTHKIYLIHIICLPTFKPFTLNCQYALKSRLFKRTINTKYKNTFNKHHRYDNLLINKILGI